CSVASRSAKALAIALATRGRAPPAGTRAYQASGQGPGALASTTPIRRIRGSALARPCTPVSTTPTAGVPGVHALTSNSSTTSAAADLAAGEAGSYKTE